MSKDFRTTHWSVVLRASLGEPEDAKNALEELCQTYWYPIYAFARREGQSHDDAEDLTQSFFEHFLRKCLYSKVRPEFGKFRSYLLVCFKNFRRTQYIRNQTEKRGGKHTLISIDDDTAQQRYALEPHDNLSPDLIYERNWAISVLDQAHTQLAEEYDKADQRTLFGLLRGLLQGKKESARYSIVAEQAGKTEAAIKMEVSRMRKRYGALLREIIGNTVADLADVEDELRYLLQILGRDLSSKT